MGLLSAKSFRYMAIGAGTQALGYMKDAREKGEKGLADLKIAKAEVDEELDTLQKNYNKALQVGGNVGGGTFANYLFGTKGIEYLASLDEASAETVKNELSILKNQFNALPEDERAKFQDYTKVAKEKYETRVDTLKKGLQKNNNMGRETTNFLAKMLFDAPKDIMRQREEIISDVSAPELTVPQVTPSGAETLRTENLYTLPNKSQYENIVYLDLYEKDPNTQTYNLKTDKITQNTVTNAQNEINTLKEKGYDKDLSVVNYLAEKNFMKDTQDYTPEWSFYENDFKAGSAYANDFLNDFTQALEDDDTSYAQDIISIFNSSSDTQNQDKAKELQIQLDNALKGIIDTEEVEQPTPKAEELTASQEDIVTQGGGRMKQEIYSPTSTLSDAEKLANSKVPVTNQMIQNIIDKNKVTMPSFSKEDAMKLLEVNGYTIFPVSPRPKGAAAMSWDSRYKGKYDPETGNPL